MDKDCMLDLLEKDASKNNSSRQFVGKKHGIVFQRIGSSYFIYRPKNLNGNLVFYVERLDPYEGIYNDDEYEYYYAKDSNNV